MLYSRQENLRWAFTASDLLLDQMEKQTFIAATPSWMDFITHYCTIVLSTLATLLMFLSLKQPKKAPVLVDAACQTEDDIYSELTINRNWQPCHLKSKCDIDDDSRSCTTETTDLFTDAENDEFEDYLSDEWEDVNSSADDFCDACDTRSNCDCKTHAEQLLLLSAIQCTESEEIPSSIYVEDYLCSCGECPQYKEIAHDVAATVTASQCNFVQMQSIIRLLQAFSTYNEVMGYHTDMILTACDCLQVWGGDEDKAFESFVTLYDEV